MFFFQRIRSPCFLPFALAPSLLSTSMLTSILSRSKESALLLLFASLKVQEGRQFTVETRGCLKCKISSRLTWRRGRTYGDVLPYGRFSQNQNFYGAPLRQFALERAPLLLLIIAIIFIHNYCQQILYFWGANPSLFIFLVINNVLSFS